MNDMTKKTQQVEGQEEELYEEYGFWHVNTGGKTIHAKRMPGRFRTIKWFTMMTWLVFFLGPYLRWDNRQAVLFDVPNRQFHIFDVTIMPQEFWMLSLILLFFAILLAAVTSVAGRVFCGYFCFQTIWTDIFTFIEEKLEGGPAARRKLDDAPWDARKIRIKITKHAIWLLIAALTGISFTAWFTDAFQMWHDFLTFNASMVAWGALAVFVGFTYLFAGFMREQVCFWLCPYARIQSVMYDRETILPAYDTTRGEPRGRLVKGQTAEGNGDCIDCHQCVAVCPTGIDIRNGQQEGCITCALCVDACDAVMEKIGKPKGLIRYASLDELEGKPAIPLFRRGRVWVYSTIMLLALSGIVYGLTSLGQINLRVLHERSPLFVMQSDGSVQNKYELKIVNKTTQELPATISIEGLEGSIARGAEGTISLKPNDVTHKTVFVRVPRKELGQERTNIRFVVKTSDGEMETEYDSVFFGPRPLK